jgi:hypothetical protein
MPHGEGADGLRAGVVEHGEVADEELAHNPGDDLMTAHALRQCINERPIASSAVGNRPGVCGGHFFQPVR